jgi:hypothetical protein
MQETGALVQVLPRVTVADVVVAAPLLIVKLDTVGGRIRVMTALEALEAPASFCTLK